MAITLRASNGIIETQNITAATNHTINLSDAAVGDVRIVVYNASPNGTTPGAQTYTCSVPSGWTEIGTGIGNTAASSSYIRVFYRVVLGGDTLTGATVNVTYSTGSLTVASYAMTFEGVDTTTVLDSTVPSFIVATAVPTSPSITTTTDGAVVVNAFQIDVGTGTSDANIPSGTTLLGTHLDGTVGNGIGNGAVYETIATAGASGVATWTGVSSEEYVGVTFALRPGVSGAGMIMASAEKVVAVAGAEDAGVFDFQESLPWGAITLALRLDTGSSAVQFSPTIKYTSVTTTGLITNTDTTNIDDWRFNGDVQLDVVTDLTDVFINGDLDIMTAGTYNFTNVIVTGDILNQDAAGNVIINALGNSSLVTSEPGTGNGLVNIQNAVTLKVTCVDLNGSPIENARVYLKTTVDGVLYNDLTNVSGIISVSYNYSVDRVLIESKARKGSGSPLFKTASISGTITTSGLDVTVTMISDE